MQGREENAEHMVKGFLHAGMAGLVAVSLTLVYRSAPEDDIFIRLTCFALAGLYAGLLFLVFILPLISDALVGLVYGKPGSVDCAEDRMREVRVLQAQGDFVGALEELRHRVTADAGDREAWSTMAKIQLQNLKDSEGSLATLREALHAHDWDDDADAFFRVSIGSILAEDVEDMENAAAEYQKVISLFPNSHYATQATHRLQEIEALQ